jgi:hypothetical protein
MSALAEYAFFGLTVRGHDAITVFKHKFPGVSMVCDTSSTTIYSTAHHTDMLRWELGAHHDGCHSPQFQAAEAI